MSCKGILRWAKVPAYGCALTVLSILLAATIASADSRGSGRAQVIDAYGKLPLSFEANQGQTDRQVKFLSYGRGYGVSLSATGAALWLEKPAETTGNRPQVLRLELQNASYGGGVVGEDRLPGRSNYFVGSDSRKWRTNIPMYARVRYKNVYPGVDLIYHGNNQQQLEYDFAVAPGADPGKIAVTFAGARGIELGRKGDLIVDLADGGKLVEHEPTVYQTVSGRRRLVRGQYVIKGGNGIGFRLAAYDRSRPLIIDPVLDYSTYVLTYLGNQNRINSSVGIAVDSAGEAYIVLNIIQSRETDGLRVAKLNADGSALVYLTDIFVANFHAGRARGSGIAIDREGNAYITGSVIPAVGTSGAPAGFPITPRAFQQSFQGRESGFVTKLDSGGSIVYSTYLAGSKGDEAHGIAVDRWGNAYVAGSASSSDFPTTSGAFQPGLAGVQNAFVSELNADGSNLVYSTYLGGSGSDVANGIAVDVRGKAYVVGFAGSADFPVTSRAFQSDLAGVQNAFVSKLSADGSHLVYSTYLGGSGQDTANAVTVGFSDNAYVTGTATSSDFPVTGGAFQTSLKGSSDAFIAKVNDRGSRLIYSTFLGGSSAESGLAIAADILGNAYVTGTSGASSDFPVTSDAIQSMPGGGQDAFVTVINDEGSDLLFSTYLGGSDDDVGGGIAIRQLGERDVDGDQGQDWNDGKDGWAGKGRKAERRRISIYLTGSTASADFPVTPGAYQTMLPACPPLTTCNNQPAFVAKIRLKAHVHGEGWNGE
jgi:hypothetical protein